MILSVSWKDKNAASALVPPALSLPHNAEQKTWWINYTDLPTVYAVQKNSKKHTSSQYAIQTTAYH